jgi:hypothetical protein
MNAEPPTDTTNRPAEASPTFATLTPVAESSVTTRSGAGASVGLVDPLGDGVLEALGAGIGGEGAGDEPTSSERES